MGSLIWKWSPKVLFQSVILDPRPRVMALKLLDFWNILPAEGRGIDLFNSLSSSNIEFWEKGEIGVMY